MNKFAFPCIVAAMLVMTLSLTSTAGAGPEGSDAARPAGPVPATLVETPHEALKAWSAAGVKGATLLLVGSNPGVAPIPDSALPLVDDLMARRDWGRLLAPGYPTPMPYPVFPGNFVSAAHRAGMISDVYWVPPAKKPVGEENFDSFKDYLREVGVPSADLDLLKRSDYAIQGRMGGIEFHISSIKDLPKIPGRVVVLFDLSFFADTYDNEVKTPFLDLFGGTVDIIDRKAPGLEGVVVSYSTITDLVPLSMRFAGGYLDAWYTSPDRLKSGPLKEWEMRAQAMYYDTFYQTEDALDSYLDAVELAPDDASLHFDLARTLDRMKELDPLKDEIDKAVKLDPGYYPQYLAFSKTFLAKDVPWAAEVCVKDAIGINPDDPRNYDALREVYEHAKMYDKAAECVEKVIGMGFTTPENFGLLGLTYTKAGQHAKAEAAFGKAISLVDGSGRPDERDAMAQLLEGLADAYAGGKKVQMALDTYGLAAGKADDPHAKMLITQKAEALRALWAPFMGGGQAPSPSPPSPPAPAKGR